eukprot:CAMPEP_0185445142 /NCGR_PEP_ID=MMETSP1365-20130426/51431_1 /TAXON_ID=38817 /ORGANISM="Gephyrocapsa oceanica, Strain RCC1303" /LENGTH=46 /DNA_ID= /DNA_START= /DNA_END= /DNA_ORIENTATION=
MTKWREEPYIGRVLRFAYRAVYNHVAIGRTAKDRAGYIYVAIGLTA